MSIDSNLDNFVQNNGRLTDTNLGSVFGAEALNPGTEYSPWVDQYYSDT